MLNTQNISDNYLSVLLLMLNVENFCALTAENPGGIDKEGVDWSLEASQLQI